MRAHSVEIHQFEYSDVNQLVKYKNNKTLSTLDLNSPTVLKKLTIRETCHNFGFGPPRVSQIRSELFEAVFHDGGPICEWVNFIANYIDMETL